MKKQFLFVAAIVASVCWTAYSDDISTTADDPVVLIRDNTDSSTSFTAGWSVGESAGNFYRSDYHVADRGDKQQSAIYNFDIPCGGSYRLYEWHPTLYNAVYDANISIKSGAGTARESIDQRHRDGQWNLVGTYQLPRGETQIIVSNSATFGVAILADAFKLELDHITGDMNGDSLVNAKDLRRLLDCFHTCQPEDPTGDGYLDSKDLWTIVGNWSSGW